MTAADTLALLDWKRRFFSLYAAVRALEPEAGCALWRETRDKLFRSHPQSPLPAERRASFDGLEYWPYDRAIEGLNAYRGALFEGVAYAEAFTVL